MKYIFHIPDLGPSRPFDTEEEAMMIRQTVADALALSPEVLVMEAVGREVDKPLTNNCALQNCTAIINGKCSKGQTPDLFKKARSGNSNCGLWEPIISEVKFL